MRKPTPQPNPFVYGRVLGVADAACPRHLVAGRQYIAVAAGGNFQLGYPHGDVVVIFELPAPQD